MQWVIGTSLFKKAETSEQDIHRGGGGQESTQWVFKRKQFSPTPVMSERMLSTQICIEFAWLAGER